ncbi:MAG: S1 RNA-binding domain-containing protein [Pirellulaceae bacterium]|nr:S1 RNA-binding domain-containing protein [Pirellulaceae bacterium]
MTTDPSQTPIDDDAPPPPEESPATDADAPVPVDSTDQPSASRPERECPDGEQPTVDAPDTPAPADTPNLASESQEASASDASEPSDASAVDEAPAGASADSEPASAAKRSGPLSGKIRIGSRRSESREQITSSKPRLAGGTRPAKPLARPADEQKEQGSQTTASATEGTRAYREKVPVPSVRDSLPPDLEREIDAALGDASLDELHELASSGPDEDVGELLDMDSRCRATVIKIHGDNVFFSLGGRNQGVASVRQFKEPPLVGAQLEVVVTGINADDGLYEVTVPGAAVSVQDWSDLVEGTVVEARITGSNTGGLECMVGSLRGFIPASQIEVFRVENYAEYYDKKLPCVVTEANKRRRNLVLSHRAVQEREKEEQRKQRLEELEVGQVVEGVVSNIRDFGAFVDIGGIDGLVHVSQLSWDRIEHPSEVFQAGQKVRVKVEKVDLQTGKIGLSYRDLLEHPWTNVEQKFPENSIVKGTVTRTAQFGAFVKLAPGVEGLVHISELAHHRVVQVRNVVKEGDEIEVKILSVDPEAQRMSLSLKETYSIPEPEQKAEEEPVDEPTPESIVPQRTAPLKGGTNRSTGGEEFGLKW